MSKIIAPFGDPIEARPPVPTFEERVEERERRRKEKEARREKRRREALGEGEGDGVRVRVKEVEAASVRGAREAEAA